MKTAPGTLVLLLVFAQATRAQFPEGRVIDLTYSFDEQTIF